MMVKILQFGLSSHYGGIESFLNRVIPKINNEKYRFDFLVFKGSTPCLFDDFRGIGCHFHFITPRNVSLVRNKLELRNFLKTYDHDVLHCHLNSLSYIDPILYALKLQKKVIVHSRSSNTKNSFFTRTMHKINQSILQSKDITRIAVSKIAGDWMFGSSSFRVIENGVNVNCFKYDEKKRECVRNKLNLNGKYVVGHVGSFTPVKNHDFLINLFFQLCQINANFTLLLIGEGVLKDEIKKKVSLLGISDKVIFLDHTKDIPSMLSAMDAFIFPSLYEGFPNVLLEAQTSGLPCFFSSSITDDIVVQSNCIKLKLFDRSENWVKNILNAKSINREIAFQKIIDSGFSLQEEISRIENVYESL